MTAEYQAELPSYTGGLLGKFGVPTSGHDVFDMLCGYFYDVG